MVIFQTKKLELRLLVTSHDPNDYTPITHDGYGLVATNNGLIETVVPYYCDTAYWARMVDRLDPNGSMVMGELPYAEGPDPK